MKILITKFRSVGDVILLTPLIRNLKLAYPNSEIDLIVNKGTEILIKHNPNVHNIILHDRFGLRALPIWQRFKTEFKTLMAIRKRRYDVVISSDIGDRGARIAYFSGAKITIGRRCYGNFINRNAFTHRFFAQENRHIVELNSDPLALLKLPIENKGLDVFWTDEESVKVDKLLVDVEHFIHIHPVSQCMYKCIADETMAKIIDYCETELKTKVIITAAPVEQELDRVNSIFQFVTTEPINLAGKLTLLETAALNKRAKALIVVDTAIMHIATANDVPVLALFGPTAVDNWGPWDKNLMDNTYQRQGGVQKHGKHTVIMNNHNCIPCSQVGCANSGISDCLNSLDVDLIQNHIKEMING